MLQQVSDESVVLGRRLLSDAVSLDHARLHFRRFNLPGVTLEAWFSSPDYAELCTRNLACQVETPGENAVAASLYLLDSTSLGWEPPPRWHGDVYDRQAANDTFAQAGLHGAYLHDPRVWQFYSAGRRLGVQLIRDPRGLPAWESGGPLRAFIHWVYAGSGRRLCHAATLGLNGHGVLLVGAGGSGKSGTTLAGIAHGLDTVGDDYCLLGRGNGRVTAHPLFRLLKQDAAGTERVLGTSADGDFGPLNWQGKYEIHESSLARSPFARAMDIRAILVPRVAHAKHSIITSIPAGAAMRAFAPSSAFQLPDGEREGIAFAAAVCREMPCMELRLSENGDEIASVIRKLLEDESR